MKKKFLCVNILCVLLMAGLLGGCVSDPSGGVPSESTTQAESSTAFQTESAADETSAADSTEATQGLSEIDLYLERLSVRQKVGQLFIVRPEALETALAADQGGVTALTGNMKQALQAYPVGGVAMFSQNITSPEQIKAFNEALQAESEIPLFLAVDEEGGLVARLANKQAFDLPKYQSAASVGSDGDSDAALSMGTTIGAYLREYGFNMDFAPVADVNTNPGNPVIGNRAFSSDPVIASRMANAMAEGLNQQGIIAVFKHFPGHGDTAEDSHSEIAVSDKTIEEMEQCEWLPFLEAGEGDCVMVGHIAVPNITGALTPATFSYQVVTEILRERLGFQGLVITDSLEMGAVTDTYSSGEAAVNAILAGCDMLLMPGNFVEAFDAVVAAVENGTISQERLDESVGRILQYKFDFLV